MKAINTSLFLVFALSISTGANAAGSMLRVTCDGDDIGAEVQINGKFKGECPMDIQVPAGTSKLLVQKKINNEDRLFEQEIRMGDGGVKKIEVRLLGKAFLSMLRKAEAGDIGAMLWVANVYRSGDEGVPIDIKKTFIWHLKAAEAGDADSMFSVGIHYQSGTGVEESIDKANQWYRQGLEISRKAAEIGDTAAMLVLGSAYARGNGVPIDNEKAAMWLHQAKDKGNKFADAYLEMFKLQ